MSEKSNERLISDGEYEVRARRGRNVVLTENIPKREHGVSHCEALVRNQSRPNPDKLLVTAHFRLERTKASIVENEEIILQLIKAVSVLESEDFTPEQEQGARELILGYTGKNNVYNTSHIKYGYNL